MFVELSRKTLAIDMEQVIRYSCNATVRFDSHENFLRSDYHRGKDALRSSMGNNFDPSFGGKLF